MPYWLVMPAAGSGERFGGSVPKQYASLAGRTVIELALAPFIADQRCKGIIVAIGEGDRHWRTLNLVDRRVRSVTGGAQRAHSVANGLRALRGEALDSDWVAIHDAARPCLTASLRDRVLECAMADAVGALLAIRVADTIKRSAGSSSTRVDSTVDREPLWAAQTPQVFRYADLCGALDAAIASGRMPTDESEAIEWTHRQPRLVEGSADNLKITTAAQLSVAEAILQGSAGCV